MNQDIKNQWTAALRSGEYSQAQAVLTDGKGYCCLGVLCELAVKAGITERTEIKHDSESSVRFGGSKFYLPLEVQEWAGLASSHGELQDYQMVTVNGERYNTLANANDRGESFAHIADAIDANWENM